MIRINTRTRTIRHDAPPVVTGQTPKQRISTVPRDDRPAHSDVTVIDYTTGAYIRTETPYKQYSRSDPRRTRGCDADWYGNWNTHSTTPRRTGADNGREPAAEANTP